MGAAINVGLMVTMFVKILSMNTLAVRADKVAADVVRKESRRVGK
jgi:hypothetical protein